VTTRIMQGDVREVLASLPADQFDCVVTSPPYWGLRDYGVAGQIGQEPTLGEHIEVMIEVFHAVRRVMKPQASLWLNYGDCYATSPNGRSASDTKLAGNDDRTFRDKPFSTVGGLLKPKDLCMVANRLAIALQENGWWVRSEIVWGKTNPMPDSSGRYRPSTAHEKIFLLTKSAKSFYDSEAVKLPQAEVSDLKLARNNGGSIRTNGQPYAPPGQIPQRGPRTYKTPANWDTGEGAHGSFHREGREKGQRPDKQRGHSRRHQGFNDRWDGMSKEEQQANGRLLRNYEPAPLEVWEMATAPFKGAHFATFPPELVRRALTAGCSKGGHVLDPFGGSGTVGLVADRMGLDATLIELNPAYVEIAHGRISSDMPMFSEVVSS